MIILHNGQPPLKAHGAPVATRKKPTERPFPRKLEMVRNAAGAVGSVIRHGAKKVSEEERAARLAICNACEFLIRKTGAADRCGKCGCFLKWKTAVESWHCPIGKW